LNEFFCKHLRDILDGLDSQISLADGAAGETYWFSALKMQYRFTIDQYSFHPSMYHSTVESR
jgi:hypothetical protein